MTEVGTRPTFELERRIALGGLDELTGIAVDDADRLYVAGDSTIRLFDAKGAALRDWKTRTPAACVSVDAKGRVWTGHWEVVDVHDADGRLLESHSAPQGLGLVTAIAIGDEALYFADATARWIRRYDSQGRFLNNIGDRHRKGGFHIPNGVVDFALADDGTLHVANPGMHRVERYAPDGELLGRFGRFDGRDPAGFSGCCNPTNVRLVGDGRVLVSEKAGPRVKLYDREGTLIGVVADSLFDPAAKNMDLAHDSRGRFYVADTARREVLVFAELSGGER